MSEWRDPPHKPQASEGVAHSVAATAAWRALIATSRSGIPVERGAMRSEGSELRRRVLLAAPALVVATTFAAFQGGVALFGVRRGYIAGFLFYWIVWAISFPLWAVGIGGVRRMFERGRPRFGMAARLAVPLLALPPLVGALFVFPATFPSASEGTLLTFAAIAPVNGTVEEILWRGVYATAFPDRALTGYVLPAAWFALLQLAALSVYPYDVPGGPATAVGGAFAVGLIYGAVAWRSRSVRWTVVSHVLMNVSGLGAVMYFAV